jgi:hypothetical protein
MTTDTLTLADELVLLAVQTSPTAHSATVLDIGVIGAEVVDLALAGRFETRDGRALVTKLSPLGESLLDARLADLTEARSAERSGRIERGTARVRGAAHSGRRRSRRSPSRRPP